MKRPRTHVTDHAVLRYLERVAGMDIEELRRRIGHAVETAVDKDASGVVIDGWSYKVRVTEVGPLVVTIQRQKRPLHLGRKRRAR